MFIISISFLFLWSESKWLVKNKQSANTECWFYIRFFVFIIDRTLYILVNKQMNEKLD